MNDNDGAYLWCSNCNQNAATFTVIGPQGTAFLCDKCAGKHLVDTLEALDNA